MSLRLQLVLPALALLSPKWAVALAHRNEPGQAEPAKSGDGWHDFLRNEREPRWAREPVEVDYGGRHPFEQSTPRVDHVPNARRTQEAPAISAGYEPMRVRFDTHLLDALSATYPSHVSYVRDVLIPPLEQFWSEALSVIPAAKIEVPLAGGCAQMTKAMSGVDLQDDMADTQDNVSLSPNGNSLVYDNTDLVVIVLPVEGTPICPANVTVDSTIATLAFASNCQNDQLDRPTVGYTGICFGPLVLADEGTRAYDRQILTIAHELTHVLGMNSYDMAFFYDHATQRPRTPRNRFNLPPLQQLTCVDGSVQTVVTPSEDTIRKITTSSGNAAYEVVTETVTNVARNQFGCQSMVGARLENQPTAPDDCFGSHWDHRLYNNHFMAAAYTGSEMHITALTLALLEDSGWYRSSFNITENSPFGLGAGCEFVEEQCIQNGAVPEWAEGTFCSTASSVGCTPDLDIVAYCGVAQFGVDLPSGYQYFEDPTIGGVMAQRDFCPMYSTMVSVELDGERQALDCTDSQSRGVFGDFKGEVFGEDSRCIRSDIANVRPVCLEVECIEDGKDAGKVVLVVEGERITCTSTGEVMQLPSGLTVICPSYEQACPQSICPANCAGRGICDYSISPAQCRCFDPGDTSPFCAESPLSVAPTNPPAPTQAPASPSAAPTASPVLSKLSQSPTTPPSSSPSTLQLPESQTTDSPALASATDSPSESSSPTLAEASSPTKAPASASTASPTAKKPTTEKVELGPNSGDPSSSRRTLQSGVTTLLLAVTFWASWLYA